MKYKEEKIGKPTIIQFAPVGSFEMDGKAIIPSTTADAEMLQSVSFKFKHIKLGKKLRNLMKEMKRRDEIIQRRKMRKFQEKRQLSLKNQQQ